MTATPPPLDDFVGEWLSREELVHLHSLRNQWGQAHVNGDLSSISWLAIPPYSGGYHTGVLRLDGRVLAAERSSWAPWGVAREAVSDGMRVLGEVRLGYEATRVLWRVTLSNETDAGRRVELEQELFAPIAHSEIDWGWLYGTPWNWGHYHDYYATERLRAETIADEPRQTQLVPHDARVLRLGSPRLPGIQRDDDVGAMVMESTLPDHSTSDSGRVRAPSIRGVVRDIEIIDADGSRHGIEGVHVLSSSSFEFRLEPVTIAEGATLGFDLELAESGQTGIIVTHGNHPDSLQIGLEGGTLWLAAGGERVAAPEPLSMGAHRIEATLLASGALLVVDGVEIVRSVAWWRGRRWSASVEGDSLLVVDTGSPACAAYGLAPAPHSLVVDGAGARARWTFDLDPGDSATVSIVLEIGTDTAAVGSTAIAVAATAVAAFEAIAERWRELWLNAFKPGNRDHSGYLPVFETSSPGLARTYYFGVLLALYMRNTGVSRIVPVFLTGGPRLGPTATFYWDISEWARTASMLEPVGTRDWILAALAQPYDDSHSFDTRNLLPIGNHYAANDHALFRTVQGYVGVTGDISLLGEIAGDRTVLDHLRRLAYRPREHRATYGDRVLVDFGRDPWELLECIPTYRDAVVSFNAGYVGMLRSLAQILRQLDEDREADLADRDADELAAAVLRQYAGHGRWRIRHPEGEDVIGHCLDFELVASEMAEDLDDRRRRELVAFVTEHLIDGDWMRALSPDDPIAPFSDRPDHGAGGAFAGWPGSTAYGLARLGRKDLAADFLARLHRSRSGALWGQAIEAIGGGRYRVAVRGASNRESSAGVAVTEAIIAGLFEIRADFAALARPAGMSDSAFGTLRGIRAVGFDLAAPSPEAFGHITTRSQPVVS